MAEGERSCPPTSSRATTRPLVASTRVARVRSRCTRALRGAPRRPRLCATWGPIESASPELANSATISLPDHSWARRPFPIIAPPPWTGAATRVHDAAWSGAGCLSFTTCGGGETGGNASRTRDRGAGTGAGRQAADETTRSSNASGKPLRRPITGRPTECLRNFNAALRERADNRGSSPWPRTRRRLRRRPESESGPAPSRAPGACRRCSTRTTPGHPR